MARASSSIGGRPAQRGPARPSRREQCSASPQAKASALEGETAVAGAATAQRADQGDPLGLSGRRLRVMEAPQRRGQVRHGEVAAQLGRDRVRALVDDRQRLLDQPAQPAAP
jgi:hypothetical protein